MRYSHPQLQAALGAGSLGISTTPLLELPGLGPWLSTVMTLIPWQIAHGGLMMLSMLLLLFLCVELGQDV